MLLSASRQPVEQLFQPRLRNSKLADLLRVCTIVELKFNQSGQPLKIKGREQGCRQRLDTVQPHCTSLQREPGNNGKSIITTVVAAHYMSGELKERARRARRAQFKRPQQTSFSLHQWCFSQQRLHCMK